MCTHYAWRVALAAGLLLAGGGCSGPDKDDSDSRIVMPPHLVGTVREYAVFESGAPLPVQGYGLVVGLGTNGSSEVPGHLRDYMEQYLAKKGIGSKIKGAGSVSPLQMLRDRDTSIVMLAGEIPFGAPVGTRFDVTMAALPNTQTRSLQGGFLLESELRFSWGGVLEPGGPTKVLAEVDGAVFVNPFVDPNDEGEIAKWREGTVLGGAKVVYAHPVHLSLRRPDFARADLIARRINETFGGPGKIANARDRGTIELVVPKEWRQDYEHFLLLAGHVSLTPASRWEVRARELVREMELPDAVHEEVALVLEAFGRNVVPLLRTLYTSGNPPAAFYAARAGARLRDEAAEAVLVRFARENSPLQIAAIEELGRRREMRAATDVLQELVDDENDLVRIAAYEALVRRNDTGTFTRLELEGPIKVDLVKSRRTYAVYATRTQEARLALFGPDMPVSCPVFFSPPDELVTVRSQEGDPNLAVFRRVRNRRYSDVLPCPPTVCSLVTLLANRSDFNAEGKIKGLGLTYGQVVSVVCRMCTAGDIPAKFHLQPEPSMMKIQGGLTGGRADVPGS